jgi:hypothetical protein
MSDEQDVAEEFDPDELGDDPEGTGAFPGESYSGATDPGQDDAVTDSYRSRTLRESIGDEDGDEEEEDGVRLSTPSDVWSDGESEAIGDAEEADDLTAEEAAVHVLDEDEDEDETS